MSEFDDEFDDEIDFGAIDDAIATASTTQQLPQHRTSDQAAPSHKIALPETIQRPPAVPQRTIEQPVSRPKPTHSAVPGLNETLDR